MRRFSNTLRNTLKTQQYRFKSIRVEFEDKPWKLYVPEKFEGKFKGPNNYVEIEEDNLKPMYEIMSRIRRLETAADQQYKLQKIRGFLHLYGGEEAVATGAEFATTKQDMVITAYRDHGHQILRGDTPKSCMSELLGKYSGMSKGKGGSMHFYYVKNNFYGGNGIVGAQVPLGTGLAKAVKYKSELEGKKLENVSLIYYGDGAANQGQVFEAYNMAALWNLPCIYICEDNRYGMGTAAHRAAASTDYYKRGAPYIPGIFVDGMNIFKVYESVRYAKEWAIKNGPIILHMNTYRYSGHSMSDPGTAYRTRDEVKKIRTEKDPITLMGKILVEKGIMKQEELKTIDKQMKKEVDEAVKFADSDDSPPLHELVTDIYSDSSYKVRGLNWNDWRQVQQ